MAMSQPYLPQDFSTGNGSVSQSFSASSNTSDPSLFVQKIADGESSKYFRRTGMKRMKAFFVGGIILALVVFSGIAAVLNIRTNTDKRTKAAVDGVYLNPVASTQTFEKGQTFPVEVKMIRKGKTVSMVELKVEYDPAVLEVVASPDKPTDPIPGVYDNPEAMPFPKIVDPATGALSDPPFAVKSVNNGVITAVLGSRAEQANGSYQLFPYGSKGTDLEAVTITTLWFKVKETTATQTYVTVSGDKITVLGSQDNMFERSVATEINIKQDGTPPTGNAYVVCPDGSTLQNCNYYGLVGLQEAVNAQPNDATDPTKTNIVVKPGTYSRPRNQVTSDASQTVWHVVIRGEKNVQIIGEGEVVLDGLGEDKVTMIATGVAGENKTVTIQNIVIQNAEVGFSTATNSHATLDNVKITGNSVYGIRTSGVTTLTTSGSEVSQNTSGILVEDQTNMQMSTTKVVGSIENGITVEESSTLTAIDSEIANNKHGIVTTDQSVAQINKTKILGNQYGIILHHTSSFTINQSEVAENTEAGVRSSQSSRLTITDSEIANNKSGVYVVDQSNAQISKTTIVGNGGQGILQQGGSVVVNASIFAKNQWNGFYQENGQTDIQNSLFIQNLDNGIVTYANIQLMNSTISDNGSSGVFLTGDADLRMFNSIVSGNKRANAPAGVVCDQQSKISAFSYNDVYGNANGNFGGGCSDPTGKDNNVSVDPIFVGGCDYHLQQSSPLVNAGEPTILDPDGSRSDIGAYGGVHASEIPSSAVNVCDSETAGASYMFGFKMQGVNKAGVKRSIHMALKSGETVYDYYSIQVESDANGVFHPTTPVQLPNISIGQEYEVLVKHDVYLRKKLGTMTFAQGLNTAPASWDSTLLLAGDFVHDNGGENLLDTMDIAKFLAIYDSFEVPVNTSNERYDITADGLIDVMDIGLILSNLNGDDFFDGLPGD